MTDCEEQLIWRGKNEKTTRSAVRGMRESGHEAPVSDPDA